HSYRNPARLGTVPQTSRCSRTCLSDSHRPRPHCCSRPIGRGSLTSRPAGFLLHSSLPRPVYTVAKPMRTYASLTLMLLVLPALVCAQTPSQPTHKMTPKSQSPEAVHRAALV